MERLKLYELTVESFHIRHIYTLNNFLYSTL